MAGLQDEQLKNPEQRDKKPLRIFYIEDQKDFRELIESELKRFTADVEIVGSFGSTEEAKDYLMKLRNENQELPDGIVSDNDLGNRKATGIEFARDLKKLRFEIPVVLFTGYAEQFKSFSQEYLNKIGLKNIVDKNKPEATENLVGVLKSIKLLTSPSDKPQ